MEEWITTLGLEDKLVSDGRTLYSMYRRMIREFQPQLRQRGDVQDIINLNKFAKRLAEDFDIEDKNFARSFAAFVLYHTLTDQDIMDKFDTRKYNFGTHVFAHPKLAWFPNLTINKLWLDATEEEDDEG